MPILNYTTKVAVEQTAAEIQRLLVKHGARAIQVEYDEQGVPTSLKFMLQTAAGPRGFQLPANVEGVWKAMVRDQDRGLLQPRFVTRRQAGRIAWRIVKDWIEAQVAIIESGQVTMDQSMLPYMLTGAGTLYELLSSGQLALPPASESAR